MACRRSREAEDEHGDVPKTGPLACVNYLKTKNKNHSGPSLLLNGQRSPLPLTSCSHGNVKPFAASMDVHMWYGVGVMWVWCGCDVGVVKV